MLAKTPKAPIAKKQPDPIDRRVGARVREARVIVGLSQETLGNALGITFQQIQKYEKGTNRVAPSRLVVIARTLGKPVTWFYEGTSSPDVMRTDDPLAALGEATHGIELARSFLALRCDGMRRKVVSLVTAMAEENKLRSEA